MAFDWQASLDNLDEVPEKYRGLYTAADGKFALDGDLAKRMDVTGLKNGLAAERKTVGELKHGLKAWQDSAGAETPEALKEARQREADLLRAAGDPAKHKEHLDKVRADLVTAHGKELEKERGITAAMRKSLDKHLVTGVATAALAEAKGNAKLLLPHVVGRLAVVEEGGEYLTRVLGEDGEPRVGQGPGGFMTVEDFVKELRADAAFAPAFAASGTTGGGKPPGYTGGGKPNGVGAALTPTQRIGAGLQKLR